MLNWFQYGNNGSTIVVVINRRRFCFLFNIIRMLCDLSPLIGKTSYHQGSLLLTRFNLNPSMDKQSNAQESVGWDYLSIPEIRLKFGNG